MVDHMRPIVVVEAHIVAVEVVAGTEVALEEEQEPTAVAVQLLDVSFCRCLSRINMATYQALPG